MSDDALPWLRIDVSGARARVIGPSRGVAPALERKWRRRALRAREEVREAHEAGVLPHGRWWSDGPPAPATLPDTFQLVGEVGALDAVTLGLPADASVPATAWPPEGDAPIVRLDGSPILPGAPNPDEDFRFGSFGPVAQALRARQLSGDRAGHVSDELQTAAAWCGMADGDPALPIAAALCPAAFDASPMVLIADPGLEPFARWLARVLVATSCKPATDGPSHVHRGLSVDTAALGDEAALQRALYADPQPWVVMVAADRGPSAVAQVRHITRRLILRAGLPVLELRVPDARPEVLLPAAWVALEAALAVAVAVGVEPLTLVPGEDLRTALDSGGGAPA